MPIASVTLSDGHGPGERAPTSIWRLAVLSAPVIAGVQIRPFVREWCSLMLGRTLHGGALMNEGLRIT